MEFDNLIVARGGGHGGHGHASPGHGSSGGHIGKVNAKPPAPIKGSEAPPSSSSLLPFLAGAAVGHLASGSAVAESEVEAGPRDTQTLEATSSEIQEVSLEAPISAGTSNTLIWPLFFCFIALLCTYAIGRRFR